MDEEQGLETKIVARNLKNVRNKTNILTNTREE
jgi:hypothetical protein